MAPAPDTRFRFAGAVIVGLTVSLTVIETIASALVNAGDDPSPVSVTVNLKLSAPV